MDDQSEILPKPSKKLKSSTATFPPLKTNNNKSNPVVEDDERKGQEMQEEPERPLAPSVPFSSMFIYTKTQSYFVTVAVGMEFIAEEEIVEKLQPTALKRADRAGKVFFATDKPVKEVLSLRSAENVYAFVAEVQDVPSDSKALDFLQKVPLKVDWEPALALWKQCPYPSTIVPENKDPMTDSTAPPRISTTLPSASIEPLFRVTGKRTGQQSFKSPEMAGFIGAGLIERYGWKVDLKGYNMEVYADLYWDILTLGICLSPETLWNRHRSQLGMTSLKPSIAYCMARFARIQPGQVVLDPMMGVGTIPIECAEIWKSAYFIGGDINEDYVSKAVINAREARVPVEIFRWTVCKLPLISNSVDTVISDIPYGRRSGSFKTNQKLYPMLFREMTRVVRAGGKALILTLEKGLMKGILDNNQFWKISSLRSVENGGLPVSLYEIERTNAPFVPRK